MIQIIAVCKKYVNLWPYQIKNTRNISALYSHYFKFEVLSLQNVQELTSLLIYSIQREEKGETKIHLRALNQLLLR